MSRNRWNDAIDDHDIEIFSVEFHSSTGWSTSHAMAHLSLRSTTSSAGRLYVAVHDFVTVETDLSRRGPFTRAAVCGARRGGQ
jgi:hypothetical protein